MKTTSSNLMGLNHGGSLQLKNISKTYIGKHSDFQAVKNVNLNISPGEFVVLLGPSGCGKTTTLRMIAGFEQPTQGEVFLDGKRLSDVTADKRPMSMVFQSYALFPHLTVKGNVEFGLKLKRINKESRGEKVKEALQMMGIEEYADRYPHQLSGGQQQRVALARALVMEPKVILFDEPLSNLDAKLRIKMRSEIRSLQKRLGITSIFVTHDQTEALTMADTIVVMNEGEIEQIASPWEIYHHPKNIFVASFLGAANLVDAKVIDIQKKDGGSYYLLDSLFGSLKIPGICLHDDNVDKVKIVIREEQLHVGKETNLDSSHIKGVVESATFDGDFVRYSVNCEGGTLIGSAPGTLEPLQVGESVGIYLDSSSLWCVEK